MTLAQAGHLGALILVIYLVVDAIPTFVTWPTGCVDRVSTSLPVIADEVSSLSIACKRG